MKFSVLMSVYYKENPAFLNEALISIWDNQILKPNQIVLVKDGFLTVELDFIIDKWKNKLQGILTIVELKENIGLGRALNEGLDYCKYDLIARMDSDDLSLPDRFNQQIEYFMKQDNLDIVGTQVAEFSNIRDNITGKRIVPTIHSDIVKYAKFRCPFTHPTIIFKKNLVKSLGGYQHHLFMEDYNLFLRIIAQGCITANLDEILVLVRAGDGLLSRRKGINYIHSEWILANLKSSLKIQSLIGAYSLFIVRALPRLLPSKLMPLVYFFLRK